MRAVVQRVSRAEVRVGGEAVGRIGRGLALLVGAERGDGESDMRYIADKVLGLRVFADDSGLMNRSLAEITDDSDASRTGTRGALLVVSQFTLLGDCRKGRRPSFASALGPGPAEEIYNALLARLRESGLEVQSGRFRTDMQVELVNDGPVTLILDSRKLL